MWCKTVRCQASQYSSQKCNGTEDWWKVACFLTFFVYVLFHVFWCSTMHCYQLKTRMQCNGTEDRWKVAWGILIDGQASLDPAYIRNESLINQFHFCERKSLFLSFSSSSGVQIHLSIVVSHWDWEVPDVTLEGFPTQSLHRQCSQKCIGYEQSHIYCTNKIQSNLRISLFTNLIVNTMYKEMLYKKIELVCDKCTVQ